MRSASSIKHHAPRPTHQAQRTAHDRRRPTRNVQRRNRWSLLLAVRELGRRGGGALEPETPGEGQAGAGGADPGGSMLDDIYTEQGNSIDEILVREGLALAWSRDGQHREALVRLEQSARRSGTGCLW